MSLRILLSNSDHEPITILLEEFKRKRISISEVAYKLGTDVITIANILAGSNPKTVHGHIAKRRLTEEDLEVICNAYIKSAKKAYRKSQEKRGGTSVSLTGFLKSFIFFWKDEPEGLDEDWLREDFYFRLYASYSDIGDRPSIANLFRHYKGRLRVAFKDIRRRLFSLFISQQYHIFPSEEDHSNREPENESRGRSFTMETVAILSNTNLRQQWKNIQNSLNIYRIAIYPKKISQHSLVFFQLNQLT